jgi:hypothetical protein
LVVSSTKKGDIEAFALNIPSPARTPDNQDDHPEALQIINSIETEQKS